MHAESAELYEYDTRPSRSRVVYSVLIQRVLRILRETNYLYCIFMLTIWPVAVSNTNFMFEIGAVSKAPN